MKPNIFEISTKELSQDAFITWLLLWADQQNESHDSALNKCGVDFLRNLILKELPDFKEEIVSVRAGRQWEKIDIWAEVNNKYLVIIEDKTQTGQHDDQLARYKETAEKWCQNQPPNYYPPICIYLKTGNESEKSLKRIVDQGFKIYNRHDFIYLLNNHHLKNDIYNDFKRRLIKIESNNNEWENKQIKNWKGDDWQGFFQFLDKQINLLDWNFVNNPNGGFWNALLNWEFWGIYPVYIQIEEYNLCFKLCTDPEELEMPDNISRREIRNKVSELLLYFAKELGISTIRRPDRFGNGRYMTVAIVDSEDWLGNKENKIIKGDVVEKLNYFKSFLIEAISQEINL
jgi:hypothetical protein